MAYHLPALKVDRKTGDERFKLAGQPLDLSLVQFWQWSCSDIVGNALRGVLAEFIVASALGVNTGARVEWDAYDIRTKSGIKVEVKSASYIQSWAQSKLSPIRFNIRPSCGWEAATNYYNEILQRQADVYVFCILKTKDQDKIDPLDLDQWDFLVLATRVLNGEVTGQKTISLSSLLKLKPHPVTYDQLAYGVELAGKTS